MNTVPTRLAILLLALAAPARAQQPAGIPEHERVAALALLWQEANYNFAFFDQVPGLDWSRAFADAVPEVQAASGTFEFYRVLQRFIARLHDGHTVVFFPDSIVRRRPVDLPWVELEEIEHRAIVANVDTALARALPPGSEILTVDGESIPQRLRREVFPLMAVATEHVMWRDAIRGNTRHMYGLLAGPAGTGVAVTARRPGGDTVSLTLIRERGAARGAWVVPQAQRPRLELRRLADGLVYLAVNSFNEQSLVAQLDSVLPELLRSSGVVLDLRHNGGGRDEVVHQVLRRLSADTLLGPAWRTRTHVAAYKAWGRFADEAEWARQYRPYWSEGGVWHIAPPDTVVPAGGPAVAAPIAVLIGSRTASAAENFLIYVHGHRRFTLIGTPTSGSSGQPLMLDLPGGGRAWICTKRNTYPDGRTYIGTGVIPDIAVPPTVADVASGRDRAMEEAVRVLQRRRQAGGGRP